MSTAAQGYRNLLAFIRLGRPHFLAAGFIMNALGVSAALYAGARLNWPALLLGQVAVTATQWMVHYANDYFDLTVDRLNPSSTFWSGGSRVLTNGEVPPRLAYRTAIVLALIAAAAALALVLVGRGVLAAALIGGTLFLSWGYSAPPFRWQTRGIGEVMTAFIVAVATPCLGFYLQARYIPAWLLLALWAPFCLQLCFQICVDFPDLAGDTAAGKGTIVVRNEAAATRLYLASLALAFLGAPLMLLAGLPSTLAAAVLLCAPLAAWLFLRAARGGLTNPRYWVANEWASVVLLGLVAAAEAAAFLLASGAFSSS